jgi:hypothetical protein
MFLINQTQERKYEKEAYPYKTSIQISSIHIHIHHTYFMVFIPNVVWEREEK